MNKRISITGLILLLLGIYFFFGNFFDLTFLKAYVAWQYLWPLILIIIGTRLLINKR